jgi:dihydroorotate dehydrogenase
MIYRILVFPLLTLLDPEQSHDLAKGFLKNPIVLFFLKIRKRLFCAPMMPVYVGGCDFVNPLGLAAGFDKNGDLAEASYLLGFGFHEIGTIVPLPQVGNPRPRIFRLTKQGALINRLGFNSEGAVAAEGNIRRFCSKYDGLFPLPVIVSVGKNMDTPLEGSADDHDVCIQMCIPFKPFAIAVNISSPNTAGLRALQFGEHLRRIIRSAKMSMQQACDVHQVRIPLLFIKVSPDIDRPGIIELLNVCRSEGVDGIVGTNTTTDRSSVTDSKHAHEVGGLSGKPLRQMSFAFAKVIREHWDGIFIYVGGVSTHDDFIRARDYYRADLVQAYTGFVYGGPRFPLQILRAQK